MPALECPLGAACDTGPESSIWKTQDVAMEHALILLENHMKYAHQNDGVLNLNENKGVQGGNFKDSKLENPTFNFHTPMPILPMGYNAYAPQQPQAAPAYPQQPYGHYPQQLYGPQPGYPQQTPPGGQMYMQPQPGYPPQQQQQQPPYPQQPPNNPQQQWK